MIEKYHKSITRDALTSYFNTEELNFINESNVNSDSKKGRAAKGYDADAQHFNKTSLKECKGFLEQAEQVVVDDFIKAAKISDDNKDDESYKQAFYDLGRLTHVIQDFYSHSNWINQTGPKVTVWNESVEKPNIKTPDNLKTGKYNRVGEWFEQLWHKVHPSSSRKLKEGNNYEETYVENSNQSHYILNKDEPDTIADKAFESKEGTSGFELACDDATQHTEKKWQEILKTLDEKLDDDTYEELMDDLKNFNPTIEQIKDPLKAYRTNFDKKMSG